MMPIRPDPYPHNAATCLLMQVCNRILNLDPADSLAFHCKMAAMLQAELAIKNPPKKTYPKTHLIKPTTKCFFLVFFKFFISYENNTNFSL
jgi:hypothetical protein